MKKKQNGIIELEEMEFFAFHGCYPEEQTTGNKFMVNVKVETDISIPAKTDNIEDALDYVKIYELVKKEMYQRANLMENVTTRIINSILKQFPMITKAEVTVSKHTPPINGKIKKISLTIKN